MHRLRAVHPGLPGRLHRRWSSASGGRTGWAAWSAAQADAARDRYAFRAIAHRARARDNDARLAAKAQAKLADLPSHTRHTDPAVIERKRAIIEAALARARARQQPTD